jgi:DNA repair protein RadC
VAHKKTVLEYMRLMDQCNDYVTSVKVNINGPEKVATLLRPTIRDFGQESVVVLHLDTQNNVIKVEPVNVGTANECTPHARDIFRSAILKNTSKLVLSHHHPSGDPSPSQEDVNLTRRLMSAGDVIGIQIIDHVIISETSYQSLRERGDML